MLAPSGPSCPVKWLHIPFAVMVPCRVITRPNDSEKLADQTVPVLDLVKQMPTGDVGLTHLNVGKGVKDVSSSRHITFSMAPGVYVPMHVIYRLMALAAGGFRPCYLFLFSMWCCGL